MLYNRSAVVDCDDCGLNKVALGRKIGALVSCCAPVQHLGQKRTLVKLKVGNFTCEQHLAALGLGCSNSVDKHFHSRSIVEGSHESARKEGIADGNRAVGFDELRDELIVHLLMHVPEPIVTQKY